MSALQFSAHDLTRTRFCQAEACPNDADGFWGLCARHAKLQDTGHAVRLHQNPPQGEPTLWCSACRLDKPETSFALKITNAGRASRRRGRFWCCETCVTKGKPK